MCVIYGCLAPPFGNLRKGVEYDITSGLLCNLIGQCGPYKESGIAVGCCMQGICSHTERGSRGRLSDGLHKSGLIRPLLDPFAERFFHLLSITDRNRITFLYIDLLVVYEYDL